MVCLFAYGKSSRSASADIFDFFLVYDNRKMIKKAVLICKLIDNYKLPDVKYIHTLAYERRRS